MDEKPDNSQEKTPRQSLKDFIEVYQKTIAVIGVFVALGLLWKNISNKNSIPYISYLCFLITIPLFLEIRKGLDHSKSSWNLRIFINILTGILLVSTYHLIADYPDHFEQILFGVVFTVIFLSLITLIEYWGKRETEQVYKNAVKYHETLKENSTPLEKMNELMTAENVYLRKRYRAAQIFQFFSLLIALVLSILVSGYIGKYIHSIFDVAYERNKELNVDMPVDTSTDNANLAK